MRGLAGSGVAWRGGRGKAWQGTARRGLARLGKAGQERHGEVGLGAASLDGRGEVRRGGYGVAQGLVGQERRPVNDKTEESMKSALFTKSYKYRAADGAHFDDAEAEVIGRELERAPGFPRLTPEIVVSVAKSPASALHRHFEWDDPSAAVLYRKEQARRILRDLIIIDARTDQATRAYQNFTKEESEEPRAYVHASEIVRQPVLADTLLDRAYSEMERWIERYGRLEEVFQPIVVAWEKIKGRRT